ncbi:hypothetical protein RRF57_007535 [Xylaria bambusicola]|uniref:Uncharacterized protein n=1 Tax=Xylaria bambusicola TaxID=326684 RepID=A0AAN7ZAH5_9PEZI
MKFILLPLATGADMATPLANIADPFIACGVPSSINYSYMHITSWAIIFSTSTRQWAKRSIRTLCSSSVSKSTGTRERRLEASGTVTPSILTRHDWIADDITLQYGNIEAHPWNATSGLLVHGYDESKVTVWTDPGTELMAGTSVVVGVWPNSHPARERLIGSGSATFTYGFLKGIRLGLLDSDEYLAAVWKGYDLSAREFVTENGDGTVD